jgi:glycolate oxidase FAD binding subunit
VSRPGNAAEVAALLAAGRTVRPVGGGTKLGWGAPGVAPEVELSTGALDELVEHNVGDLTAVVQAGVTLADAQARFAKAGQRLALDPPDGDGLATFGGIVATGDSGPLRHRFGSVRDLILGVQVALADGTVARAGSKVIKNVAGYDLAKLMCGSLGTLGVVCEVTMRLHPRPAEHATAIGRGDDPDTLAAAGRALARRPLELEALDLRWEDGAGAVLAGSAGHTAGEQAEGAAAVLRESGLDAEVVEDDDALWAAQRDGQRGACVVRVSATQRGLGAVLAAARELGGRVVARAALGLAWVGLEPDAEAVRRLRAALAPAPCVLLDAPAEMRAAIDPWDTSSLPGGSDGTGGESAPLELMRAVKARFDPRNVCNPGLFVGGI